MHFSSLVPLAVLSSLSLTAAQYTEILTSAIAELSQATATITVHSGAQYQSAVSEAESGYNAITGLLYANPSLSSQYSSLVGVYASELSGFTQPAVAASTITSSVASSVASSASKATSSAAKSLSSAISSATSAASSISSSISSATSASSAAGSSTASSASAATSSPGASTGTSSGTSGAGVIGVSVMGVLGASVLGLAAWL